MNALKRYTYFTIGVLSTARMTLAEIEPGLDRIDDGLKGPNTGDPITTIQSFLK